MVSDRCVAHTDGKLKKNRTLIEETDEQVIRIHIALQCFREFDENTKELANIPSRTQPTNPAVAANHNGL